MISKVRYQADGLQRLAESHLVSLCVCVPNRSKNKYKSQNKDDAMPIERRAGWDSIAISIAKGPGPSKVASASKLMRKNSRKILYKSHPGTKSSFIL